MENYEYLFIFQGGRVMPNVLRIDVLQGRMLWEVAAT